MPAVIPPFSEPGHGTIETQSSAGRTYIARLRGNSPLKLLTPAALPNAASVIVGSFGGGLVSGDTLRLDVRVGAGSGIYLGTQASTKIFRSVGGQTSGQSLSVIAGEQSVCVVVPDPVTPFEGAIYHQRQRFDLAASASLVMLDCLTAGRCARGERWAFERYSTRTDIVVEGRHVFRDALLLDSADGALDHPMRVGRFQCLATVLIVGPAVRESAAALLAAIGQSPVGRGGKLVFAASPFEGGVVVRAAGDGTQRVVQWIRDRLEFVTGLLGENPWIRKW